ncbi:MAG: glycosyl transferase [Pseudooceanicola sp.]|nr:glycosyl transferase [Pseudooceanicola sp.]
MYEAQLIRESPVPRARTATQRPAPTTPRRRAFAAPQILSQFIPQFPPQQVPPPPGEPASPQTVAEIRADHAEGRLSDDRLVPALIRNTEIAPVALDRTPPDPTLSDLLDPAICLQYQCIPHRRCGNWLWIATARPECMAQIRQAFSRRNPDLTLHLSALLAPRDTILAHLAERHRPALTERAQARVALAYSCRGWRSYKAGNAASLLSLTGLPMVVLITMPHLVFATISWLAAATLVIASTMKLAAATAHLIVRDPPLRPEDCPPDDDLPTISVLAPMFREPNVAAALVKRLQALDYPRAKLEVLLVLEEVDGLTREVLEDTALPPWFRVVIVPDGAPRTKPRAMNYALDFCTGDIIAIYDAEDAPDPDQLLKVATSFASAPPDVVCLQGALDYYNDRSTWIARCFTIEYNTWFRLLLPGMGKLGFALPLGGTSLFFRRAPLEELGGWDAHNVTEDADLGFRLARAGYRTRVIDTTTKEEAANRVLPWCKQRSRWLKGYCVTYLVHMRKPLSLCRDLGFWRFIGFQAHFVTALTQFALAPLLWVFWLVTLGVDLPFTTLDTDPRVKWVAGLFLMIEALTLILGFIGTRRPRHRHLWAWVPLMHFYWPMGAVAMWKALYELIVKPHYWDKTQHGQSVATWDHTVPISPESSFSRVTKALEI